MIEIDVCVTMSKENYFDRLMPRRSLAGFRSSSSTINDRGIYSSPLKQLVRKSFSIDIFVIHINETLHFTKHAYRSIREIGDVLTHLKFISLSVLSLFYNRK